MVVLAGPGEATQEGSHAKFSFLFIQRHPEAFRGLRLVGCQCRGIQHFRSSTSNAQLQHMISRIRTSWPAPMVRAGARRKARASRPRRATPQP